jgi:hypothetical protein
LEIWLKQGKTKFRFAVIPPDYEVTKAMNNTSVDINAIGEITLLGKRKLKTIPLASIFPKRDYYFCQYTGFPTPKESVKIIEKMQEKGVVRLTMTGTPVSMDCTIENFVYGENDATKDIYFSMDFKEYINPKAKPKKKKETVNKNSKKITVAATNRSSKTVESGIYKVKDKDTLSKIAKTQTGSSANWRAIYNQNKSTIGDNPNNLYVGEKLVISV